MSDQAASLNFSGRDKKFCCCSQCPAMPRIQSVKYIFLRTSSRPGLRLTDFHLMPMLRMCDVYFHCSIHPYDLVMNQEHGIYNALTMLNKQLQKVNCTLWIGLATSVYCLHAYAECSGQHTKSLYHFAKLKQQTAVSLNDCHLSCTQLKKKCSTV